MPLEKSQIFHIVGEIVVIVALFVYFQMRIGSLTKSIQDLERVVVEQNKKLRIMDIVLQEVVNVMPNTVRGRISQKIRLLQQSGEIKPAIPKSPLEPKGTSSEERPVQQNPLQSVMNMIGPMMSSMMVAGMAEDASPNVSIVEEPIVTDEEISEELKDLKESEVEVEVEEVDESAEVEEVEEVDESAEVEEVEEVDKSAEIENKGATSEDEKNAD
jgi:hypothetical protein